MNNLEEYMVFHNKFVAFFSFSWTYANVVQIREINNVNHTFTSTLITYQYFINVIKS